MNTRKVGVAIGFAAGILSLAGCAGKTRYPNYYVLNLPAPVAQRLQSSPSLGTVAVREFRAPAFLSGGPIVYHPSEERVEFYNYHHWAEDPRKVVTARMIGELQARGIFLSVNVFDGHPSDCIVTGTLDHLEEVDQGSSVSIEVSLSATLRNLTTSEVLWHGTALRKANVDERSVSGVVAEMSRELDMAIEELVSSMQNRLSTRPSSARTASVEP